jgi:hypothetical protein
VGEASADSEDSFEDDREGEDNTISSSDRVEGKNVLTSSSQRRRSSAQTDSTPRLHNKRGGAFANLRDDGEGVGGLPPIPFQDRSERSPAASQGQRSLSSFIAKNNNSSNVTFNLDPEINDSVSEPSLPAQLLGLQLTPTSNAASTYSRRTPDPTRRSAQQIGMDGAIQTLTLSPAESSRVSQSSAVHSRAGSHSHHTPQKHVEDKRKSYFTATQELRDTLGSGSMHSIISGTEHYPTERPKDYDTDDDYDLFAPVVVCGYMCPVCFATFMRSIPSLHRISLFFVNVLPCFWCCGSMIQGSSTDRTVLTRLNVLCLVMTFTQLGASLWLATVLLFVDDAPGILTGFAPNFWNLNGPTFSIGILAFILIVTCSCTIRVIREVDLVGAIRYLWVLLWIVPFEIFFTISLYDYHNVTSVWIRHW